MCKSLFVQMQQALMAGVDVDQLLQNFRTEAVSSPALLFQCSWP